MSEPPTFPVQRVIAACPHCGTDLIDEAYDFWCPACRVAVSFAEAAIIDETDYLERD